MESLQTRPRHHNGVDWGAERIVLAKSGKRELWWEKGSYCWEGILTGRVWHPSKLTLIEDATKMLPTSREMFRGGRLSYRRVMEHAPMIDAWLGEGTAAKVAKSYHKATVISDAAPAAEHFCMIGAEARKASQEG